MQSLRNTSVVRQPNAFQSERPNFSKTWVPQKVNKTNDLSNPVTSNSVPTPRESKAVENAKVIAPAMFRIDPCTTTREDKFVPINKVRASVRTNPITASQPYVLTKKVVNSDPNSFSSIGVDITTKTRRPQPRSNTKNDRGRFQKEHLLCHPDISFLYVFGALCYPKNDHDDIRKLGVKGDIGFFIGYSANSCAYRVYNRRTRQIMETMNVTFDELLAMAYVHFSA
ncbi:hypothetical protein Tco_0262607 [Tanacetum coccineum]